MRPGRAQRRSGAGRGAVPSRGPGGRRGRRAAATSREIDDGPRRAAVRGRHAAVRRLRGHLRRADRRASGCRRPRSCPGSAATTRCSPSPSRTGNYGFTVPDGSELSPTPRRRPARRTGRGAGVQRRRLGGRCRGVRRDPPHRGGARLRGRRRRRGAARRRRDRAGRRRARTCSPGRDVASGRRCPRRCSGSRSPTRTPARRPSSCSSGPARRCCELDEAMKTSQLDLDYARVAVRRGGRRRLRPAADPVARRALPRLHPPPAARRRDPRGRADHPADAGRDAAAHRGRRRPAGRAGGGVRPAARPRAHRARRCSTRWPRGSPSCTRASRRRSSGSRQLQQRFAAAAVAPVADNVTEARARLAAAEQEVHEARAALAAPEPGDRGGRHPGGRGRGRADRRRCWTRWAGSPPTSTRRAPGSRPCGPRRRRTSPRPGR